MSIRYDDWNQLISTALRILTCPIDVILKQVFRAEVDYINMKYPLDSILEVALDETISRARLIANKLARAIVPALPV